MNAECIITNCRRAMTPDQLKHAMLTLGLTDKQLAQLTGKHDRTVRRWVSGEIGVPHLVARLVGEMMERVG